MSLADLADQRLGPYSNFEGATWAEKLMNGRNAARDRLNKYVPNLECSVDAAVAAMGEIDGWATRNEASLSAALQSGTEAIAEELRLQIGNDKAASFVIATFSNAARGLGPWMSGAVDGVASGRIDSDVKIGPEWAVDDAMTRLKVFAAIVKMDDDGELATIFGSGGGTAGLGLAPVYIIVAIVVTVLSVAAIVYVLGHNAQNERNNKLMADMCKSAQARGDASTVSKCIEAAKDLQTDTGLSGILTSTVTGALGVFFPLMFWGGLVYLGIVYGIPALQNAMKKRGPHGAAEI